MAEDTESIKCVIFTLRKENVLVPDALVAEIISVKDIEDTGHSENWYMGRMEWRGADVPLLSFEAASGASVNKVNLNTQAVVLYAVGKDGNVNSHPYLGLVMSGVPHVSRFTRDQIKLDDVVTEDHPMVSQRVRINGASISILDVDAMVDMVAEIAA
jgi:chemosensory pili system protein ChpC